MNSEHIGDEAGRADIVAARLPHDRDAVIMEVASWIEEGDLRDYQGTGHKRKRVREDALLRLETSKQVRERMAAMVRARMDSRMGDPVEFMRDVRAGHYDRRINGYDLRAAVTLADKGLMRVCVLTQIAGPWNNTVGGITEYKISLTAEGESFLDAPEIARLQQQEME